MQVKKSAKRAIAKKALEMKLASSTCYELDVDKQMDTFFEVRECEERSNDVTSSAT